MAIIDLASLCSPIHTFRRGLIFGHSENVLGGDQGGVEVGSSSAGVGSLGHLVSGVPSEVGCYVSGGVQVANGVGEEYPSVSMGAESRPGGVSGSSSSMGLASGFGQKAEVYLGSDSVKADSKSGCHLRSGSHESAVLVRQVPLGTHIEGGGLNLMKITQNIQSYGFGRYSYEGPGMNSYQKNTVAIFDLDDTLIPTDWIRDTYSKIRQNPALSYLFSNSSSSVYQYIRMQIDQQVNYQLAPNIIRMLTHAKNMFLDVAIVTNARSTGWLKVIETMFPELTNALKELGIPIIRTNPTGKEPDIEEGEKYFNYWMLAKKFEFEKIVSRWNSNAADKNINVDLISIGDNDFEECAAVHLAVIDKAVRYSKIIRCASGLSPKAFIIQLQTIFNAMEIERKRNSSHSWINYSNTVSSIIIENDQFSNSDSLNILEDYSTEDE